METMPRPRRDLQQDRRGLKGKKPFVAALIHSASATENGASIPSATLTQTETQTQIANRLFRQRAEKINEAHVTVRAGENEWEPIYRVEVPELRSEAFDKIVALRSRLYRKYPEAIINIEFRGRRELDEAENHPRFTHL